MFMLQLTLLSHAEVKVGFFITEVIGDFPEPEARKFFQELMSNNREVTDKKWATIFEVHRKQISYLSFDLVQLLLEQLLLLHCRCVGAMLAAWSPLHSWWNPQTMSKQVSHLCWLCIMSSLR